MTDTRKLKKPLADFRILVVEDEFLVAEEMRQMLTEAGAEVIGPVSTLEAANRSLREEVVTGAILDVNLQGRLVYPLAEELDEKGMPYIFVTGYDAPDIAAEFQSRPRLDKPVSPGALVAVARKVFTPDESAI